MLERALCQALVVHICYPTYSGEAEIRGIVVQGQPRQIVEETHLQNNQSKMDWRHVSSGRAPALQSPELKPSPTKKKEPSVSV
jgi:hypothetical protein